MTKRYEMIKNITLGETYELSLVFADDTLMHELNFKYRKKDKPTDVLSFSLEKNLGEIFINKKEEPARKEYLFIHAMLHLKGLNHSEEMDKQEKKILKKIIIKKRRTGKEIKNQENI